MFKLVNLLIEQIRNGTMKVNPNLIVTDGRIAVNAVNPGIIEPNSVTRIVTWMNLES